MRKVMAVAIVAVSVLALAALPAAAGGREVIERGQCSGPSDWKLKVKADDGGLELEFEVDQNRNGEVWSVRIFQDGDRIFAGRRTTTAPSGSFEVERRPADRAGTDRFVARARNVGTGERCRGTASF